MFFSDATFIGIDPTAGERPFVYAALDGDLCLLALGQGTIDDVLAFCAGQQRALAAVCAPRRPNQGLMEAVEVRESLTPPPTPGRWGNFRVAEYLLRQHNIHIQHTPSEDKQCPKWMQMGFAVYRRLEAMGYQTYPQDDVERGYLEVYPHGCYSVMLEMAPFSKRSLEGRLQRQLALYEARLDIPDPMRFFEEITRYRLLHGILPLDTLYTPGELDALAAAYTAWLASTRPGLVTLLGDSREGQIVLPVSEMKDHYSAGGSSG